jgi:hypothetical protein
VHFILVEKSSEGLKLSVYNETLALVESDSFEDSYSLNFHLQALAKKHRIENSLMVTHDKGMNAVDLSLGQKDDLFFVS